MTQRASYISIATAIGLLGAAITGGVWVGAIASDVETLQGRASQQTEDHDRLIKVEQQIENISDDVKETKEDVKEIKKLLHQLNSRPNDG